MVEITDVVAIGVGELGSCFDPYALDKPMLANFEFENYPLNLACSFDCIIDAVGCRIFQNIK